MKIKAKNLFFSLVGALLLVSFAQAQERRTIPVSVVDKDGNIVEGLTAENFQGKFRGQSINILKAEIDDMPRQILIVVHTSNIGPASPGWNPTWGVAEDLIRSLGASHDVALFSIGKFNERSAGFHRNPEALLQTLLQIHEKELQKSLGGVLLIKSLLLIPEVFPSLSFGDVVYVISDFIDREDIHRSERQLRQLKVSLASSQIRMFAIWVNDPMSQPISISPSDEARRLSDELAEESGGLKVDLRVPVPKSDKVMLSIRALYDSITRLYFLQVEFGREIDKPRKWKLEVVDEHGKKMKGVKVFYPRLLVPLEEPGEK